ncbi:MAG: tetratricopeptide repeat protein [Armatimonas sp.]
MERALTLYRESEKENNIALVLGNLAIVYARKEELDKAQAMFEESLVVQRKVGDRQGSARTLDNLAKLATVQKEDTAAQKYAEESLTLRREIGDHRGTFVSLQTLAKIALRRDELEVVKQCCRESLDAWRGSESLPALTDWLYGIASLCIAQNDAQGAATLMVAADTLKEHIGLLPTPDAVEQQEKEWAEVQAALSPEAFEAACKRGKSLSYDEAIVLALEKL